MTEHEAISVRDELDKIRAFAVAAHELLGGKHFTITDDEAAGDSYRKEAIDGVKPLLDHLVRYCNTLDDTLKEMHQAPTVAAGSSR